MCASLGSNSLEFSEIPGLVPEGEEEEQEIKNLLEKIMKENFASLVKEIDFQEVQESQGVLYIS